VRYEANRRIKQLNGKIIQLPYETRSYWEIQEQPRRKDKTQIHTTLEMALEEARKEVTGKYKNHRK